MIVTLNVTIYILKTNQGDDMLFSRPAGHSYIDRGFITANDYRIDDFTLDGAWHTLDLTSIIGKGIVVCMLLVYIKGDAAGLYIRFKENGADNDYNVYAAFTQVANVGIFAFGIVAPDSDSIIEYCGAASGITNLDMIVKGWIKK